MAQGWTHADDADALREDPILRLAVSERKGQAPLRPPEENQPQGLASQPTLSRLLGQASTPSITARCWKKRCCAAPGLGAGCSKGG